jgi:hypothetical protein
MVLAVLVMQACGGGGGAAPEAGGMRGFVPDLRGRRVMVYPVQIRQGVPGDVDPEIAFAFRDRGSEIEWVFPEELRAALERAPVVQSRVDGLPVSMFLGAEVDRVGDPLYGQIRRLSELVNSDIAIIPVTVRSGAEGVAGVSVVEVVSAILDVRTGRVMWTGVVAGRPGPVSDFGSVASAVEKLAETLLWYVR